MTARNRQLLDAISNGDSTSFGRIVHYTIGVPAFKYARTLFDDMDQAEDVASRAIDKVVYWLSEKTLFTVASPTAYMLAIAKNHIKDESENTEQRFLPLTPKLKQELVIMDEGFAKSDGARVFKTKNVGIDAYKDFSPLKNPRLRFLLNIDGGGDREMQIHRNIKRAFYKSLKEVYAIPTASGSLLLSLYLQGYNQNEIAQNTGRAKSTVNESINNWLDWLEWRVPTDIVMFRMSWIVATLVRLYIISRIKMARTWDEELGCWRDIIKYKTTYKADRFGVLASGHPEVKAHLSGLNDDERDFYLPQVPACYSTILLDPPSNWRQILPAFETWAGQDYKKLNKLSPTGSWAMFWEGREIEDKRMHASIIRRERTDRQNWRWGVIDRLKVLSSDERAKYLDAWKQQAADKSERIFLERVEEVFVLREGFHSQKPNFLRQHPSPILGGKTKEGQYGRKSVK